MDAKKFSIVIITILFLIACGTGFMYFNSRDYIDGNVLNLPLHPEGVPSEGAFTPRWAENGLVRHLLFRTLFLADATLTSFTPDLAESYNISDNGLIYSIQLKDNIFWSDGSPITAYDFESSFNHLIRTQNSPEKFKEFLLKIRNVEVSGKEITITLSDSHANTIQVLSQIMILPKEIMEMKDLSNFSNDKYWDNPKVSGMYMLTEVNKNQRILEINPYYADNPAKIEKIILHGNQNMRYDMYMADGVYNMINYRAMRGFVEYRIPTLISRYFAFNIQGNDGFVNKAMQDIEVRTAIAKAIDRQAILKTLYHDIGEVPVHTGFVNADELAPFNQEEAKALLATTNYDLTRPLRVAYYQQDTLSHYFMQHIVRNLELIGFHVQLIQEKSRADLLEKRNFDVMVADLSTINPIDRMLEYGSMHQFARIYGGGKEFDFLLANIRKNQTPEEFASLEVALHTLAEGKLYRYPLISLRQAVYVNADRVKIPKEILFGSPLSVFDFRIGEWEIKKK